MSDLYGNAKFGGDFVKRKYFKLKDGEATFRILPPLNLKRNDGKTSDLGERGIWSMFYEVHYGYKNSKGQMRLFQSPQVKNRKTKMIEVGDAALDKITKLKAALEDAKKSGNKEMVDRLDKLVGQKGQFNLDKNHYLNVIDTQGNIGILKLRHRAKSALDATIKRLRETGVEPLSPTDGRFFVFRRSGNGLDTTFQVDVLKEKLNVTGVGMVERDVVHVLTQDISERVAREAAALDTMFKRVTEEEVKRIVNEGTRAVDEILDAKSASTSSSGSEDDAEYEDQDDSSAPAQQSAPVAAPAQMAAPTTQTPSSVSAPTQVASSSTPPSNVPQTTAQAISEQSDEEFLKSLGL